MTTPPQQRIESDLKAAMKSGERERRETLRLLLAEVKNERIRRGSELDEGAFIAVVRRALKQREEAAAQYRKAGRDDLAAKEESEGTILAAYLPAAPAEDEIRAAVRELIAARGLSGPAAIGPIMKEMLARFGAAADGATVNRIAREALAERPAG
jgi:uncharacterized protein YqeY